jgi:NADH-quinone oxidoreductase subunit A
MEKHVPNLLMAVWAFIVFGLLLVASSLVRPNKKNEATKRAFLSGEQPKGQPWVRVSIRYRALLSLAAVFFLGILVLYPAATAFRQWLDEGKGVLAFGALVVFLGTLSVALAYAWMNGDLSWIKEVETKEDHGSAGERVS